MGKKKYLLKFISVNIYRPYVLITKDYKIFKNGKNSLEYIIIRNTEKWKTAQTVFYSKISNNENLGLFPSPVKWVKCLLSSNKYVLVDQ